MVVLYKAVQSKAQQRKTIYDLQVDKKGKKN